MKSNKFLQLITLVFTILVFSEPLKASPVPENEAIEWANQTGLKLISALGNPNLETKYQELDRLFEQDVDTPYLAKFVLGKYWKNLNAEQKAVYVPLFKRYVLSLYKNYPLDFKSDQLNYTINAARISGNYTDIFCTVDLPEKYANENLQNLKLEFKVGSVDGKIKIVDLKIGESSLLLTYRQRFMTMIKEADEDINWFLEDFEILTLSNEKNIQEKLEHL